MEKDHKLAVPILQAILDYWPKTCSPKEVLFLNEVEEVLESTQTEEFVIIMDELFGQMAKCISSQHFQVAERALFFWNNEYICALITQHRDKVLRIVFPALSSNQRSHWNTTVHGLTCNVTKMFQDTDGGELWEKVHNEHKMLLKQQEEKKLQQQQSWAEIDEMAKKNPLYMMEKKKGGLVPVGGSTQRVEYDEAEDDRMFDDEDELDMVSKVA